MKGEPIKKLIDNGSLNCPTGLIVKLHKGEAIDDKEELVPLRHEILEP